MLGFRAAPARAYVDRGVSVPVAVLREALEPRHHLCVCVCVCVVRVRCVCVCVCVCAYVC